MNAETVLLAETALHRALRRAYRAATREYREQLSHLGLTSRQAAVILAVAAQPGIGLRSVAEAIDADQPTTSALVDRLVERGLFAREPDPGDRRRSCLQLTPAAHTLAESIQGARVAMEQRLTDTIGDERARTLLELLRELTDRLGEN